MGSKNPTDFAIGPPPPDGNQNRGGQIIAVDSMIFGISWSLVLLRTVTRTWITRNFGWDDATIIFAAMTNAVGMGYYVAMVFYGLGRHKYYLSNYGYKQFLKYDYLDWIQTFVTLAVSKISVCLFLLRLSKFNKLRRVLLALIAFLLITHLPIIVLWIVQCNPVSREWNSALNGRCFSKEMVENILIAQGVFSIVTDFVGAAFPVVLLWNVKIKLQDKIALWILMGFGLVTGIACTVRTGLSYQVKKPDLPWVSVGLAMAKCLEVNFGIIAACLPLLKPFYTFVRFGQTPRRSSSNTKAISSGSRGRWYRLRLSRTAVNSNQDAVLPSSSKESEDRNKRQFTWRKPIASLPSLALKKDEDPITQDTTTSLGLPLQGIRKTTELSIESDKHGRSQDNGVELEEFV